MQIKLLVDGGAMKPGPALSQKLGPLGINLGKVISEVNKATTDFNRMKVPVLLDIDPKTKDFTIKVSTPPTAELLKKEFGLAKGSPQPHKIKIANAALEHIIKIAKTKQPDMLVNSLQRAVCSVVGSCVSLGILVESKDPKEMLEEINQGKWDNIINKGSEQPSVEKLEKLEADFKEIQESQKEFIKELEKKIEEAAAPAAPAAAEGTEEKAKEEKKA